jgi:protein TonB
MKRIFCGVVLCLGIFAGAWGQDVSAKVVRVSGGVMAGQVMTKVDPVYPPEAREQKISGAVVLRAVIGEDGSVQNLSVVSGPKILQEAALDAVRQWTYKAYLLNGNSVAVETTITVNFALNAVSGR